jgi:hypothetical protein
MTDLTKTLTHYEAQAELAQLARRVEEMAREDEERQARYRAQDEDMMQRGRAFLKGYGQS